MALPVTFDPFLKPIRPDAPEGDSLRYSPDYDMVRNTMRFDDPNLPMGVWLSDLKTADWKKASALCCAILQNKSKDLQISAWLTEAWLHQYNLAGVKSGLNLLFLLAETFWDKAYPQIAEDGNTDFRASPFVWLNEKFSKRLQRIEVTVPHDPGDSPYTFSDWITLSRLKNLYPGEDSYSSTPLEQVGGNKQPTLLDFNTNLRKTPSSFFKQMRQDVGDCLTLCQNIETFLDSKIKVDAPSLFRIKNFLNDLLKFIITTLYDRGETQDAASLNLSDPLDSVKEGIVSPNMTLPADLFVKGVPMTINPTPNFSDTSGTLLQNRDAAYEQINNAADYLAKIEPHSPVPYLIKRAVSWRNKTFLELMQDIGQSPQNLADFNRLLGITPPEDSGDE